MKTRWYVDVLLYNYDIQQRYDRQKVYFKSLEEAQKEHKDVLERFSKLSWADIMSETAVWCQRHGWSDAWVKEIYGLYEETVRKVN